MPLATEPARFSPEAYLEWEKTSDGKHEYLNGEVFALAGWTRLRAIVCSILLLPGRP